MPEGRNGMEVVQLTCTTTLIVKQKHTHDIVCDSLVCYHVLNATQPMPAENRFVFWF